MWGQCMCAAVPTHAWRSRLAGMKTGRSPGLRCSSATLASTLCPSVILKSSRASGGTSAEPTPEGVAPPPPPPPLRLPSPGTPTAPCSCRPGSGWAACAEARVAAAGVCLNLTSTTPGTMRRADFCHAPAAASLGAPSSRRRLVGAASTRAATSRQAAGRRGAGAGRGATTEWPAPPAVWLLAAVGSWRRRRRVGAEPALLVHCAHGAWRPHLRTPAPRATPPSRAASAFCHWPSPGYREAQRRIYDSPVAI